MSRIRATAARPSLPLVVFSLALTVCWWTGLCLASGRIILFW